jgi:hypothetical protein
MKKEFDLQTYLISGVQRVVTDALKATMKDPKGSAFMMHFAADANRASKKRMAAGNTYPTPISASAAVSAPVSAPAVSGASRIIRNRLRCIRQVQKPKIRYCFT